MDKQGAVFNTANCGVIFAVFLIISVPLLLYQNSAFDSIWSYRKVNQAFPEDSLPTEIAPEIAPSSSQPARTKDETLENPKNVSSPSQTPNSKNLKNHTKPISPNTSTSSNKHLDGLLPLGFDDRSCLSRYSTHLYRKPSPHKPSPRLLSKLRAYERLHRHCGPKSSHYKPNRPNHTSDCNYIVWFPVNGLGNRMISLAATFLYAILTNRVLLVAFESEMSGVFCEPFLNSSWKLPHDFPHRHRIEELPTYARLVKPLIGSRNAAKLANSIHVPPFLYVDLQHHREENERFFHCGEGQTILARAQFLFMRSDQYFAPSLFMVPSFEAELDAMFPDRDAVFHHLGRYLYSPSNEAWWRITRFYKANLSKADKKVGIQVRVFAHKVTPAKTVTGQILSCGVRNNVLPEVGNKTSVSMAVMVTSLHEEYSKGLRGIYEAAGEAVHVYQPSHEEVQRFNNNSHHVKALTEMYLLSLCDELVTSGQSTFGYVAQSLGAIKPWIMYKTVGTKFRDPPCKKALSMEPCFHFPPRFDCQRRIGVEHMSSVFPHMRRCEDIGSGLKMVAEA
ncbi:hypothetical protein V2J09_006597 [Rumex salicifolius]